MDFMPRFFIAVMVRVICLGVFACVMTVVFFETFSILLSMAALGVAALGIAMLFITFVMGGMEFTFVAA